MSDIYVDFALAPIGRDSLEQITDRTVRRGDCDAIAAPLGYAAANVEAIVVRPGADPDADALSAQAAEAVPAHA